MTAASHPERLAEAVGARRIELGIRTAKRLAEASSVSPRLIGEIENGRRKSYSRTTLWALDDALRWKPGSAQAILDGGDPTPMSEPASAPAGVASSSSTTMNDRAIVERLVGDLISEVRDGELDELLMVAAIASRDHARKLIASRGPRLRGVPNAGYGEDGGDRTWIEYMHLRNAAALLDGGDPDDEAAEMARRR